MDIIPLLATGAEIAIGAAALAGAGATTYAATKKQKLPQVEPASKAPAPVTDNSQEVEAKRRQQRRNARLRKGRSSTLLARDHRTILG